jgi:hypothetical protein
MQPVCGGGIGMWVKSEAVTLAACALPRGSDQHGPLWRRTLSRSGPLPVRADDARGATAGPWR